MKRLLLALALVTGLQAQNNQVWWMAASPSVSLSAQTYSATIQQQATNQQSVFIDYVIVSCSATCTFTGSANGTAATATKQAPTVLAPSTNSTGLFFDAFFASNVGSGTQQTGINTILNGGDKTICLSPTCGNNRQFQLGTAGTASNYSINIASLTGTVTVTFYGRQGN